MAAFHPSFASLPAAIPIFPLSGALLLPRGRLPLNIFEPRYLNMVADALGDGRMLGMIQPEPGSRRGAHGPDLYRVGCLGRLSSFAETEDGRFLITLTGVIRFQVAEELPMGRLYRRVRAEYGPFRDDLDLEAEPEGIDRAALLAALRPYFRVRGIEANWEAVEQSPDGMLVTSLAMLCPFEPREKQALLEAGTPADRAAMLVALLQMGAHGDAHPEPSADQRPS